MRKESCMMKLNHQMKALIKETTVTAKKLNKLWDKMWKLYDLMEPKEKEKWISKINKADVGD